MIHFKKCRNFIARFHFYFSSWDNGQPFVIFLCIKSWTELTFWLIDRCLCCWCVSSVCLFVCVCVCWPRGSGPKLGFPAALGESPGRKASPWCSFSNNTAWSYTKSQDTALAGAGRSVVSGPWRTPQCSLWPVHQSAGSKAAPYRRSGSPTASPQTPTRHWLWWTSPSGYTPRPSIV